MEWHRDTVCSTIQDDKMDKKTLIILGAVVIVIAIAAVAVVMMNGGSNDNESKEMSYSADIRVSDNGTYLEFKGEGTTYQEILKDALGDDVVISNNGNVHSYKGKTNQGDKSWVVFRWKAPETWQNISNKDLCDGMTLALEYSTKETSSTGAVTYSKPDLKIEYEAYFFIQIPSLDEIRSSMLKAVQENVVKLDSWLEKSGVDDLTMKQGFWIKGKGANACEALANAVHDYMFPSSELELVTDPSWDYRVYKLDGQEGYYQYGIRTGSFGWFNVFLGWDDTDVGGQRWTYWSQYTYNPNAKTLDDTRQWNYNQNTFGNYDMDKYPYYAVILQTTTDSEEGVAVNIPTPSDIPASLKS